MVPWTRLPKDVQKAILALIVISGSSSATSCLPPMVCDPPPTPAISPPNLTRTPIICDAMPLPSATRKPPTTPPVCDPAPPPATRSPQPTRTAQATRRFRLRSLQMSSDPTLQGAAVRGTVYDKLGQPLEGIKVTVRMGSSVIDTVTVRGGSFSLRVPEPGAWQLVVGDDTTGALPLQLKQFDVANVEWAEIGSTSQAPLPLAEIRTVDILWGDDLTFQIETPWPGARYRWTVTGGKLLGENEQVTWEPPAQPGRYLLQLVADWGYEALAVDSLVLTVNRDGSIYIS